MVIMHFDSQALMYVVVIASILTWMATQIIICFKYGVLVKSKIQ
jgi:hypothetical protein